MSYELTIFELFSKYDKRTDTNKDGDGKGTLERYNECIGVSIDEDVKWYMDNMMENIYDPDLCLSRYVVYLESMFGFNQELNTLYLGADIATRRKIVQKFFRWVNIKGTKRAYILQFAMLGLAVDITEYWPEYGFDSPVTLDDVDRRFDMRCATCSAYSIDITTELELTPAMQRAINSIILFNEPINARIKGVTFNGDPLAVGLGDYNLDHNPDFFT